jgi:hypothetical protein
MISAIVRDTTNYTSTEILRVCNQTLRSVAGRLRLPELATTRSVTTQIIDISTVDITGAQPVTITTTAAHGLSNGDVVIVNGSTRITGYSGNSYTITLGDALGANPTTMFRLDGSDGADFTDALAGDYGNVLVPYVNLPSDFHKDVYACYSSSTDDIVVVVDSYKRFLGMYPELDWVGTVWHCCVRQKRLYYQYMPSTADTLRIHYYRLPTDMANDANYPDGLPEQHHEDIIVYGACEKIFAEMGMPYKMAIYKQKFDEAFQLMLEFYDPEDLDLETTIDYGTYTGETTRRTTWK